MAQAYVADGNPERAIEEYKLALVYDPNSALIYTRLATEYVKAGSLSSAMEMCKEALQRDPNYTDAALLLAGLYSTTHDSDSAIAEYDRILKAHPDNEEAIIYKSQVLIENDQFAQAARGLNIAVKKNPGSAVIWYALGRADQRLGRLKKAITAYLKALDLRPGFSQPALALGLLYEQQGLNDKAVAVYKDLFDEDSDPATANRIATILLKEEKYADAVPYLEAVRAGDPDDMNARVKLGLVQMELKKYDQAIALFQEILKKNPDSDRIHYYLGSVYEEVKKTDEAIAELKKIQPDSNLYSDSALHVAYLLKQENRAGEARDFIAQAIEKSPKNPGFYIFAATLDEDSKSVGQAIDVLEKGVKIFPENEKMRYYLGSLYDRQSQTDKSVAEMEAILRVNPQNVDALNYIGYTWTIQGTHLSDAEKLLRKALKLRPDNGYIQDSWGWYLFVRGKTREAIAYLERAAQLKPNEPEILEHLGDAYLRTNLREKAYEQYVEAAKYYDGEQDKKKIQIKLENLRQELARSTRKTDRLPASAPSPSASASASAAP